MKKKVMISIDESLLESLDFYSLNLNLSRSALIRLAIFEFFRLNPIDTYIDDEDF